MLELEKTRSRMFPEQLKIRYSWKNFKKEKESMMREDEGNKTPEAERPNLSDDQDTPGNKLGTWLTLSLGEKLVPLDSMVTTHFLREARSTRSEKFLDLSSPNWDVSRSTLAFSSLNLESRETDKFLQWVKVKFGDLVIPEMVRRNSSANRGRDAFSVAGAEDVDRVVILAGTLVSEELGELTLIIK
ncbi:Hypothetical protein CINCED_3A003762 [Cinara cedri]|uniref:Uncharacterized protein n=1 Tax=Cinara cedri TaxID=506608 RepID=A0A5E4N0G5_9HEMI|nr:Hypothetical protein CINCED_3A003762 [Cinara cedri]